MSKSIYFYAIITLTKKDNQFSMMFPFFPVSILKEEDESSLPSPPPVPLVRHQVVHPSKPSDVTTTTMTCQNHNGSFYANSMCFKSGDFFREIIFTKFS